MKVRIRPQQNGAVERSLHPVQHVRLGTVQPVQHRRVNPHRQLAAAATHMRQAGPPQLQANRRDRLDPAPAPAGRAGPHERPLQVLAPPLPGELNQAELRDLEYALPGAVLPQFRLEPGEHRATVFFTLHVDQIDDEDAGQVPQPNLADGLRGRFEIGPEDRVAEVARAGVAAGVHVDRHQSLGLVDNQVAAGRQRRPRLQRGVDANVDAVAIEQTAAAPLEPRQQFRLNPPEVLADDPVGIGAVDPQRVEVLPEMVANHPYREFVLLVDQCRGGVPGRPPFNLPPGVHEDLVLPPEVLRRRPRRGRAHDAPQRFERIAKQFLGHRLQARPFLRILDPPGDPQPTGQGRQHQVAAGNRDLGGDPRSLVRQSFPGDLNDDVLASARDAAAPPPAVFVGGYRLVARHLLEVQVAVPCQPQVDEGGPHAGKNPPYPSLVNVADEAAAAMALDEELHQPASLQNGEAGLVRIAFDQKLPVHLGARGRPGRSAQMLTNRCTSTRIINPVAAQQKSMKEPP